MTTKSVCAKVVSVVDIFASGAVHVIPCVAIAVTVYSTAVQAATSVALGMLVINTSGVEASVAGV